jgi:hypothetical protein
MSLGGKVDFVDSQGKRGAIAFTHGSEVMRRSEAQLIEKDPYTDDGF